MIDMYCPKCGKKVERNWEFCSHCGTRLTRQVIQDPFSSIFQRMMEEFSEFDDIFSKDFEVFDMTPFFISPKRKGFSISIKQTDQGKPEISVRTFGDVDRKEIEKQIERGFGIKPGEPAEGVKARTMEAEKKRPVPEVTEEPKTDVRRIDNRIVVEMNLPGVKSEEDVDILELSESVEVKGFAKNKVYFKILKIPRGFSVSRKEMKGDKLILEFSLA